MKAKIDVHTKQTQRTHGRPWLDVEGGNDACHPGRGVVDV